MRDKKWEVKKVHIAALAVLVFAGCLLVLSKVHYSDGDDAFFLEYCGSMSLTGYLKWRYETWTGRMVSEAFMHIFFNRDIWFWRIVNAGMLTALPLSLVMLKNKVVEGNRPIMQRDETGRMRNQLLCLVIAVLFYLLIDIKTLGYSCIWITGSINYLWPDVCGITALCAVAMEAASGEAKRGKPAWIYVLSVPCAIAAAMSSEQMGAVVLAFEVICIGAGLWQKKMPGRGLLLQTAVTAVAFAVSGFAPGNELRVAASVDWYIPQFESFTIGERLFLTVQWLVSSFANENVMLLVLIWIAGIFLLVLGKKDMEPAGKEKVRRNVYLTAGGIFTVAAIAGKLGLTVFCDMGIDLAQMAGRVETVPAAADMTAAQWFAFGWWSAAIVFTFFLLREVAQAQPVVLLTYLGAIASEAIMFFSPSIYSSGERVFFLADIMLLFLVLVLFGQIDRKKCGIGYIGIAAVLAVVNFGLQAQELSVVLAQ